MKPLILDYAVARTGEVAKLRLVTVLLATACKAENQG